MHTTQSIVRRPARAIPDERGGFRRGDRGRIVRSGSYGTSHHGANGADTRAARGVWGRALVIQNGVGLSAVCFNGVHSVTQVAKQYAARCGDAVYNFIRAMATVAHLADNVGFAVAGSVVDGRIHFVIIITSLRCLNNNKKILNNQHQNDFILIFCDIMFLYVKRPAKPDGERV